MRVASFVRDLWEEGQVTLGPQLLSAGETDDQESVDLLLDFYREAVWHLPGKAPPFDLEAAVWAAKYLLVATQIAMLRDIGNEAVKARLLPYAGSVDASAVFSADLMLRYLPDLLQLAKGLAPDDVLVQCLQQTLADWPFSSVGTGITGEVAMAPILSHPALRYAYRDKVIRYQDKGCLHHPVVRELVKEALGEYASVLWPAFE